MSKFHAKYFFCYFSSKNVVSLYLFVAICVRMLDFPVETVEKLARFGFLGIPFPKKYGGAGGDYLTYAMAVEELGKVCATTAIVVSAHTSLCAGPNPLCPCSCLSWQ